MTATEGVRKYPQSVKVGSSKVTLRGMTPGDKAGILAFARAMPHHDLLFLRRDITQEVEVDAWVADTQSGIMTTVIAEQGAEVVG